MDFTERVRSTLSPRTEGETDPMPPSHPNCVVDITCHATRPQHLRISQTPTRISFRTSDTEGQACALPPSLGLNDTDREDEISHVSVHAILLRSPDPCACLNAKILDEFHVPVIYDDFDVVLPGGPLIKTDNPNTPAGRWRALQRILLHQIGLDVGEVPKERRWESLVVRWTNPVEVTHVFTIDVSTLSLPTLYLTTRATPGVALHRMRCTDLRKTPAVDHHKRCTWVTYYAAWYVVGLVQEEYAASLADIVFAACISCQRAEPLKHDVPQVHVALFDSVFVYNALVVLQGCNVLGLHFDVFSGVLLRHGNHTLHHIETAWGALVRFLTNANNPFKILHMKLLAMGRFVLTEEEYDTVKGFTEPGAMRWSVAQILLPIQQSVSSLSRTPKRSRCYDDIKAPAVFAAAPAPKQADARNNQQGGGYNRGQGGGRSFNSNVAPTRGAQRKFDTGNSGGGSNHHQQQQQRTQPAQRGGGGDSKYRRQIRRHADIKDPTVYERSDPAPGQQGFFNSNVAPARGAGNSGGGSNHHQQSAQRGGGGGDFNYRSNDNYGGRGNYGRQDVQEHRNSHQGYGRDNCSPRY